MNNAAASRQSPKSASKPERMTFDSTGRLQPTLSREQVARRYECSHIELCRLLRERKAPLPVRIEDTTLWYEDEVEAMKDNAMELIARRRSNGVRR